MHRSLFLTIFVALTLVFLLTWSWLAVADETVGATCSQLGGNHGESAQNTHGGNVWCNGSTWQNPAYVFGSTGYGGCSSSNAGQVQWNGTAFQACNGSTWSSILGIDKTMFNGWPDAIVCNVTNPNYGPITFIAKWMPYTGDGKYYYDSSALNFGGEIGFNSNGSYYNSTGITSSSCSNLSISQLYSNGQAFNLVNGTGTSTGGTSTGLPFSSLVAAVTTNSIDSGNWASTWAWGTLSTQTALTLSTSSITTGTLLSLANTSTASSGKVISATSATTSSGNAIYGVITGAGNTGYAGYFSNSSTSGTNYAIYASNAAPNGYGVYATNINSSGVALWCSSTYANGCGGNESWYNSSDIRLKAGIAPLPLMRGLGGVMQLRPVTFHWKDPARGQREHIGLVAQEVEAVYPEVVSDGPDGMKSMSYSDLVVPLIKAMQEQETKIEALQVEIATLKAKVH